MRQAQEIRLGSVPETANNSGVLVVSEKFNFSRYLRKVNRHDLVHMCHIGPVVWIVVLLVFAAIIIVLQASDIDGFEDVRSLVYKFAGYGYVLIGFSLVSLYQVISLSLFVLLVILVSCG